MGKLFWQAGKLFWQAGEKIILAGEKIILAGGEIILTFATLGLHDFLRHRYVATLAKI